MTYSEHQLQLIELNASIYMKISEIAILIDVDAVELRQDIADRSTEASRRYLRGKISARARLLEQEMKLAQIGSPLALDNVRNNLMDMEDDE